jgi:two-component system, sensor histidine kinase PdtaS
MTRGRIPAVWRTIGGYVGALLLCAVALAVRLALRDVLPVGYPYVTFFPGVMLAAFMFGRWPGILAGAVSGTAAWYYFVPPYRSFALNHTAILAISFYAFIVGIYILLFDRMRRTQDRLEQERARNQALAEHREMLFKELQHRISNNLLVVSSLLRLHRRKVSDEQARAALKDASQRLDLIARVHRSLHDQSGETTDFGSFLRQLSKDIVSTSGMDDVTIDVRADSGLRLNADRAIPCALIVAEAIANAVEHGFAGRGHGHIDVLLEADDRALRLSVIDDGHGIPEGFDAAASDSLGLTITRALARQLGGAFELLSEGRTISRLTLPH